MIFSEQHQQLLAVLAPYLPYEIEVETRAHGRGILVGLPFCQAPCEKPRAEVRLHRGGCDEVLDLADVKPVLIRPTAFDNAIFRTIAKEASLAYAVGEARRLHFALGLSPDQYVEKPNHHNTITQKERDAA